MNGKGVFAQRNFEKDEPIIEFRGELLTHEQLPDPYDPADDHYLQIGKNLYLGPSGGIDDMFNHSCDPNSGVKFGDKVILVAIKDIYRGEEILFDYSTTLNDEAWEMDCNCGCRNCRGKIRDFKYLPRKVQQKYLNLGIVPDYISESYVKKYGLADLRVCGAGAMGGM
jgi:SET domain-containing protein